MKLGGNFIYKHLYMIITKNTTQHTYLLSKSIEINFYQPTYGLNHIAYTAITFGVCILHKI